MRGRSLLLRLWLFAAVAAQFVHLGSTPLIDADEGRNAEVAREMAATNDYIMPRLDGMPYLDKPIVYFAAEAAAMEIIGPTELAARLPAALFTLLTAGVVFWFARRQWGDDAAWAGAIVFLSMPLTIAFARTVIFDSALTFFIVTAIVALHESVERTAAGAADERRARRVPLLIAWGAIGFGILTKGPVAIAVPLLVAVPYAIRRKAFRALWSWSGLFVAIVVVTPWVWAVSRVVPDFLNYVLVTETAQRLATKALKRTGPPWYFIPYVLGGAIPWSLVMFNDRAGRGSQDRETNARLFVLLWIVVPFLFFSLSQSKRPQYILPVMPAVALLIARMWNRERMAGGIRAGGIALLVLGALLLVAPYLQLRVDPAIAAAVTPVAMQLGALAAAAGIVALLAARHRREVALAALTLPMLAIPLVANPVMTSIGGRRSAKAFVEELRPYAPPSMSVIGIGSYTGSLQFYLGRPITVVTPDAEEFTSNYIIRHFDRFAGDPTSPVRRPEWLRPDNRHVYVVRTTDRAHRALLERSGLTVVAGGIRYVAYAHLSRE